MKKDRAFIDGLIDFSLFAEQIGGYSNVEEENEVINKIVVNIIQYCGCDNIIAAYCNYVNSDVWAKTHNISKYDYVKYALLWEIEKKR